MAKDKEKAKDKEPGGRSRLKLIMVGVAILIALAGGAGGGYYAFAPKDTTEPAPEPGIVCPVDPVTINLAEGHYLKFGFALQATAEVAEKLDGSKALDIAIDLFSNRTVAELSSNEERKKMRKEFKEKVIKAYHKEVMDVYLTSFVMQ